MTVRERLRAQLQAYDDDAWSALANRGLLRRARKDLELAAPTVVEDGEDVLRVQVGSHVVVLDARGPAQAACSCPSSGPCQHLLAAGIWLSGGPDDTSPPAHEELLRFDAAALSAHAGRAGHRWAAQYVTDLDLLHDVRVTSGRHTVIAFTSPRVTFRYMGGGLEALVPDTRLPSLEKYQVAAVLAYQRAHGVEPEPVAAPARRAAAPEPLEPSRARLREATTRLLADTVRLGLSHLSSSVQERFETVAVWAQGASYFRLALLLRRLADHVELLLVRSAHADESRLLDEVATAYALVAALDRAARQGSAPAHLVGRARNRYDTVRRLELIGLGSLPWHAPSGYRGLTTLFWWPAETRFLSLTDARPDTLGGWDPRTRHTAAGPWQGLSSPAAAAGARVQLVDAQLSASGRLSGTERTHAVTTPLDGAALRAELPVVADFGPLSQPLAERARLLAPPERLLDWAVLAPATVGETTFDPASQSLSWPVADAAGVTVRLTVSWSDLTAAAVQRLERMVARGVAPGTLLVCRLRSSAGSLTGELLSLVHPDRSSLGEPVEELHFGDASRRPGPPPPGRAGSPSASLGDGATRLPRELSDLTSWHRRLAERGTSAASATAPARELDALHARLRAVGLVVFAPVPTDDPIGEAAPDLAHLLLTSRFVALQVQASLAGRADG